MGFGTYGALGGVNLGRRLGVKSHADPHTNRQEKTASPSTQAAGVRGSEYAIMSTAKCASLAVGTIVGEFSEVGKCFGYATSVRRDVSANLAAALRSEAETKTQVELSYRLVEDHPRLGLNRPMR